MIGGKNLRGKEKFEIILDEAEEIAVDEVKDSFGSFMDEPESTESDSSFEVFQNETIDTYEDEVISGSVFSRMGEDDLDSLAECIQAELSEQGITIKSKAIKRALKKDGSRFGRTWKKAASSGVDTSERTVYQEEKESVSNNRSKQSDTNQSKSMSERMQVMEIVVHKVLKSTGTTDRNENEDNLFEQAGKRLKEETKKKAQIQAAKWTKNVTGKAASFTTKAFAKLFRRVGVAVAASPVIGLALIIISTVIVIIFGFTATTNTASGGGALSGNAALIYAYLNRKEVADIQIAAILGNLDRESGLNPSAVEVPNGIGHGLCQWSFGRWRQLEEYADSKRKEWDDLTLQLDFFWMEYSPEADRSSGAASFQWPANGNYTYDKFVESDNVENATMIFCRGFERAGIEALSERVAKAEEFYALMQMSGGNYDGTVTELMTKIVEVAKNNEGSYPCTPDMCAAWVSGVYEVAGAPVVPRGDAIDMWNTYAGTGSTSKENIPPGAIVCGSGSGGMGALYGHVGVYIGNGMVANNVGRFSIEPLEQWISWQTATCQGHTGWIGWIYPGGVPQE